MMLLCSRKTSPRPGVTLWTCRKTLGGRHLSYEADCLGLGHNLNSASRSTLSSLLGASGCGSCLVFVNRLLFISFQRKGTRAPTAAVTARDDLQQWVMEYSCLILQEDVTEDIRPV